MLLGFAAAPLDFLLQFAEERRYRSALEPQKPLLFICGAPRTGTTLVEQVLIQHLPFAFMNNLTSVFPRAPLTANRIFRPQVETRGDSFHSYYGKTTGFGGPNDGLHLWDRWLGTDRTRTRTSLTPTEQSEMRSFFGAMEQLYGKPILAKNNNLNACAALVAEVFDRAFFICMTREPLFLAQSQLQARQDIHGRADIPYGLTGASTSYNSNVIDDICHQVLYHRELAQEQQRRIGADRFWIVQYEAFCHKPSALVEAVAVRVLGQPCPPGVREISPFKVSNKVRIEPERMHEIAACLTRLDHSGAVA